MNARLAYLPPSGHRHKRFKAVLVAVLLLLTWCIGVGFAAEVIPPAPKQYFNDYAHVVSPQTAAQLNQKLEDFERQTSSQILVAIYPTMQSDSSIEDYTVRVAESWKVGQKLKNNGAVLFVFIQNRTMYIQVGYGLEGALPDALAKQIIDNELRPHFRNGDFDGGFTAAVNAMLAAARGEYKGTGRTVSDNQQHKRDTAGVIILFLIVGVFGLLFMLGMFRSAIGGGYRRRYSSWGGWTIGSGGWGGGGWGGGGGGGWSGGGGFSGGGGSFGGGGAGGSW